MCRIVGERVGAIGFIVRHLAAAFDSPHGSTKSRTALPRDMSKTRWGASAVAVNAAAEMVRTCYPSQRPLCRQQRPYLHYAKNAVASFTNIKLATHISWAAIREAIRRSLIHMLAVVLDLDISAGAAANFGWQKENLLEILICLFCDKLLAILHQGMPRRYVGHEDDLSALRGRLDVKRQFTVLTASPQRLACRFDELSTDIALNRIMKAAITRLMAISNNLENQRKLRELAFAYEDVTTLPVRSLGWDQVFIDRTNVGWSELFRFARLLLEGRFQSTTTGTAEGISLLFEMNTLFEEFVGRTIRRALAGTNLRVDLQGPQSYALIDQKTNARRFATDPISSSVDMVDLCW
jgi:5-methylcytosine-specific restriction enzyme subunit McrC